ncbi:hypothetical protein MOP88_07300 [Sphingomonas sp. WKB10]|nr:hypothetical protein [Sphingomonas sp. WKB10]
MAQHNKPKSIRTQYRAESMALRNAIHRCHNPKHIAYGNYGKRGIFVCDEWRNGTPGFIAFLAHIGPRPSAAHSLDRINNDMGYFPGNVRWSDRKTQQLNRRPINKKYPATDYGWGIGLSIPKKKSGRGSQRVQTALIPHEGKLKPLVTVCEALGLKVPTVRQRLERGLPIEEALSLDMSRGKHKNRAIPALYKVPSTKGGSGPTIH